MCGGLEASLLEGTVVGTKKGANAPGSLFEHGCLCAPLGAGGYSVFQDRQVGYPASCFLTLGRQGCQQVGYPYFLGLGILGAGLPSKIC
jgi:hypothetical protein